MHTNELDQRVLTFLQENAEDGESNGQTSDLAARMGVKSFAIEQSLRRLCDAGDIEPGRAGFLTQDLYFTRIL